MSVSESNNDLKEISARKALLLLRRERELYDLRQLRARTEDWLRALHSVRPESRTSDTHSIAIRITERLVADLGFEVAGVFECHVASGELRFAWLDPNPIPDGLCLSQECALSLDANRMGLYPNGDQLLSSFANALDLKKFFWSWADAQLGYRFLLLAGCTSRSANFYTLSEIDLNHFAMFASHAAALLNNSTLLADLARERHELETANVELDDSLRRLQEAQRQLLDSTRMVARASRQAGMAEIATGILHNVGNVLNSVSVCAEVASDKAGALSVDGLHRLVCLLESESPFANSSPLGAKVIAYLRGFAEHLSNEQGAIRSELQQLQQHLTHVASIVSRQQAYAKTSAAEPCKLADVMLDALALTGASSHRGAVKVVQEFEDLPEVEIDKHRVLQILVNLMSNALRALSEVQHAAPCLVARIRRCDDATVRLEVQDNGVGVAPEHQDQLFGYGFTTRRDGHGFGLHTCALTAKELGGSLSFVSAGRGQGATFVVELPFSPRKTTLANADSYETHTDSVVVQGTS